MSAHPYAGYGHYVDLRTGESYECDAAGWKVAPPDNAILRFGPVPMGDGGMSNSEFYGMLAFLVAAGLLLLAVAP